MRARLGRFALIATAALLVAQASVCAAPSKTQQGKRAANLVGIHILNFPPPPGDTAIPDETCGSVSGSDPKCQDVVYRVQVIRVLDPRQNVFGCIAVFPYNSLRVLTTTNKEEAYVKWDLDPGDKARFSGVGIVLKQHPGNPDPGNYFDAPVVTSDTSVSVHLRAGKPHGRKFDHLPQVTLTDGDKNDCLGVDPTIGNSAN